MAFLLDTNVVSEPMRPTPEPAVEAWASALPRPELFLSTVSEAELRYGAAILPEGRRRETLYAEIEAMLGRAFGERVLAFDRPAARAYADVAAMRRRAGRPVESPDCQIAAIAMCRGMTVATRNVRDFEGMAVAVVDPWAAA